MKKLITADDVKRSHQNGDSQIACDLNNTIITPEARDVAKSLSVNIISHEETAKHQSVVSHQDNAYEKVEEILKEKIGSITNDKKVLIKSLIEEELKNFNQNAPDCAKQINDDGIVLVRGNAVKLDIFDGAPGKNIGLKDMIGSQEKSHMGVGYMGWENAFFPWHLDYDETDVVLEGELHIKTASGVTVAKPGDVIFIPKNSSIEFGTPSHVKFVYITYPADWN